MAATCKTNKKTTVVFRCPFDGKVSLILEDFDFRAAIISIKNLVPRLVWLASLLWKEKEDPFFSESGRFLPIMIGEGDPYFGKDDLFFFLHNCLPDRAIARSAFLFCQRRGGRFMGEPTLVT